MAADVAAASRHSRDRARRRGTRCGSCRRTQPRPPPDLERPPARSTGHRPVRPSDLGSSRHCSPGRAGSRAAQSAIAVRRSQRARPPGRRCRGSAAASRAGDPDPRSRTLRRPAGATAPLRALTLLVRPASLDRSPSSARHSALPSTRRPARPPEAPRSGSASLDGYVASSPETTLCPRPSVRSCRTCESA
jgi:hypothetical protein